MKRIGALAVVSLLFLSACSSTDTKTPDPTPTSSESTTGTAPAQDEREYTLADGTTVKFDRLGELPPEMTADIDARLTAILQPPSEAVDNHGAFKAEAAVIGTETGKYVGGVIGDMYPCDGVLTPSWIFAAQTLSSPVAPECGSVDPKGDAAKIAEDYIKNAMGGPDAWILFIEDAG